ncbi:hypothetical protein AAE02nite_14520 [Adhaeribacter aerolatus]|uniref:DUF1795 domain-containing protein n=1 Tax=Adhaeribacter aerolatus TaxID=670289 RepID=A0A512AVP0_9BACT|nr:hypothetical protein [Adhaeribacter aerolatus]GEO03788.1 hypothetical protein AAE02nite_14520 [Adhaeribacter aerolatus]
MMKYFLIFSTLLVLLAGFVAPKFKTVNITKNISVSLPQDFAVMPDEVIASKYPSPRKPLAAYTSPNRLVDFVLTERPSMFHKDDLKMVQQFYKTSIQNKYSDIKFMREEIKKIRNQDFVIFEFTSTVRDEDRKTNRLAPIRRYTIVQYTIFNEKLYIFTINVPIDLKPSWEKPANKIMESVKVS